MARAAEVPPASSAGPASLRERGAQTVRALGAVGNELFPLKQKAQSGVPLTKQQRKRLEQLESRYRVLEGELRELMRPRAKDPWLYGVDHLHGPDGPQNE
jgi:hypothetical protein